MSDFQVQPLGSTQPLIYSNPKGWIEEHHFQNCSLGSKYQVGRVAWLNHKMQSLSPKLPYYLESQSSIACGLQYRYRVGIARAAPFAFSGVPTFFPQS